MKSSNRLQIRYHLSSKGPRYTREGTSIIDRLLSVSSSLPEKTFSRPVNNRTSNRTNTSTQRNTVRPTTTPQRFKMSGGSTSSSTSNRNGSSQGRNGNSRGETPNNRGGSSPVSTATMPRKKMKVNRNNNQGKKKAVGAGRTGIFKNERSTTYRRDFIKANPPFLGKWYMCALCFKPITIDKMQVDHIYPVSKGGSNSTKNLGPLCAKCNNSKSDKVDSRVIQGYAVKIAGNTLGIPIAMCIKGTSFALKTTGKVSFFALKSVLPIAFKAVGSILTAFMATSMRSKLIIGAVLFMIYYTYG